MKAVSLIINYSLTKNSQTRVGNVLLVFGSRPKGSIELKETEVIDVSRYPDLGERIRPFHVVDTQTTNDNGHQHCAIIARLHVRGSNCRRVRE